MRSTLRKLVNRSVGLAGYEVHRDPAGSLRLARKAGLTHRPVRDPATFHMVTPRLADSLVDELARTTQAWLQERPIGPEPAALDDLRVLARRFLEVYARRPFLDNTGGSGFHNSYWIYTLGRLLQPRLIVESGIWKGHSLWLWQQGAPDAVIHGFDVNLGRLAARSPAIAYHEMDWAGYPFDAVDPGASLCFFDCHVNQAQRVREAYDKGFRLLLFDDNCPADRLYAYGYPAAPTIDMLLDDAVGPGDVIEWVWQGKPCRYEYSAGDEHGARELIERSDVLPNVGDTTLYGGYSYLTLVELVD